MSDEFDRREDGFEKRFVIGEELRFKALARRNKLLGLWVAKLLGYEGDAAKAHADALVVAQVARGDDAALAAELSAEFARAGVNVSPHRIHRKMEETMALAVEEIQAGR